MTGGLVCGGLVKCPGACPGDLYFEAALYLEYFSTRANTKPGTAAGTVLKGWVIHCGFNRGA